MLSWGGVSIHVYCANSWLMQSLEDCWTCPALVKLQIVVSCRSSSGIRRMGRSMRKWEKIIESGLDTTFKNFKLVKSLWNHITFAVKYCGTKVSHKVLVVYEYFVCEVKLCSFKINVIEFVFWEINLITAVRVNCLVYRENVWRKLTTNWTFSSLNVFALNCFSHSIFSLYKTYEFQLLRFQPIVLINHLHKCVF